MTIELLDKGYVRLIEHWGSDERIIESARMSTAKGFLGWGLRCASCKQPFDSWNQPQPSHGCPHCKDSNTSEPGDERLLRFLWDNAHATPFEMAGLVVEVKAPIFVFREWHRHRTQSFNEMSARYVPLPNESYVPTVERLLVNSKTNKQAGTAAGASALTEHTADLWLEGLQTLYARVQDTTNPDCCGSTEGAGTTCAAGCSLLRDACIREPSQLARLLEASLRTQRAARDSGVRKRRCYACAGVFSAYV